MTKLFLYYIYTPDSAAPDSHALLSRAAALHTGEPASAFLTHREQGKKPRFASHPGLHFSVSHSGNLWVCAFANREVGCDVQLCRPGVRFEKLAERWFHPNEAASVRVERDFYDIWSRKEAFVKALGIGIDTQFRTFDSTCGTASMDGTTLEIRNIRLPDSLSDEYAAAIAYNTDFSIECINLAKI